MKDGTNEVRVLTPTGMWEVNSIRRMPVPQRRDPELLKAVRGLPWEPVPKYVQRPARVGVTFVPAVPEEEAPPRADARREEIAPRQLYIRRKVELAR